MRADRAQVRIGEAFHLQVTLRVDETISQCDDIVLPTLFGFDALGDERRTYTRPAGTECSEIVTLNPTIAGSRTIAPATLEAIDPNTSMPSRFSTNTVTIRVLHAPLSTVMIMRNTFLQMLKAIVIIVLSTTVLWLAYWVLRRTLPGFGHVQRIVSAEVPGDARTLTPIDEAERWRTIIAHLSAEPTRGNVIAIRMILRDRVQARDDEVFGELLARIASATDPLLLDAMRAVERAAFIDEINLPDAIREVIRTLENLANTPPILS